MNNNKLKFFEKVGYGIGDTASNLFWQTFTFYLLYFYTDVFGLEAAAAGFMFFVVRIIDTFFDPVMGMIADRTHSRWGKFRPYLLWIAVPFGLLGFLTFLNPGLAGSAKVVYAYITYTAMMLIYSAINVPYGALMGVMTSDPLERTSLSSFRFVFAFIGGMIVQKFTLNFVRFFGGVDPTTGKVLNEQLGFSSTMGLYAILAILLFIGTFLLTRERVKPVSEENNSLSTDLSDLLKNKPWVLLTLVGIFTLTYVSIRNGSIIYYFKYYVKDSYTLLGHQFNNNDLTSWFMVLGTLASIAGTMSLRKFSNWFGKKNVYLGAMLIATIVTSIYYFLSPKQVMLMFVLQILVNFIVGPTMAVIWAMYADTADYSEWKTGRRATGLVYSSATMAQKFGWSIGGALAGFLLAYFGFKANIVQTAEAEKGIKLLISVLPAVGSILAASVMLFYKLDEKTMKGIEIELENRRTSVQS
jgi:glycoside/pentoside/hexuronide:cation symporter, GPH family